MKLAIQFKYFYGGLGVYSDAFWFDAEVLCVHMIWLYIGFLRYWINFISMFLYFFVNLLKLIDSGIGLRVHTSAEVMELIL